MDVYVNGDYQGVYNLCDQVETGDGRVDIRSKTDAAPEETDFLIEQDYRAYFDGGGIGRYAAERMGGSDGGGF